MAGEVWKQTEVARSYLEERVLLIPDRGRQFDVLLRLIRFAQRPVRRILDLGCGDGVLLGTLLDAITDSSGVAVDFSPPMLDQARQQLDVFGDRVQIVEADLSTPAWNERVTGQFDAVVSGFAIHHLPHARKRSLYQEIFNRLELGGLFVNTEHVASVNTRMESVFIDAMTEHLWRHRHERGDPISQEELHRGYVERQDRAANILAPVEEQCRWLEQIGFVEVDCFWKYFELAIFAGTKPI